MDKPLLSVIIPVYNAFETIEKCLESVLNQTLKNIEIIIIDDCSKDSTPFIIEKYLKDDRIIFIENEENIGVGETRNKALILSKGKYIGFIDNDDWIEPDYFEKMVSKLEETSFDICVSLRIENHKGKNSKEHLLDVKNLKEIVFVDRTAPWAKVIRRSFLIENNIKFDSTRGEDIYPAFLSSYLTDKITYVKDTKYHCNIRQGSISHSKIKERDLDEIRLYEKIINKTSYDTKWQKSLKERSLITFDFLYKNADSKMKKTVIFEYKKLFKTKNLFLDYTIWKISNRFKKIKTMLNARFSK